MSTLDRVESSSASGLPNEVTSFVGRRQERAEIRQALSQSRLVTLTGFGGIGKTRLAVAVASDLRRAFSDGACFVPLGSMEDPEMIASVIARGLGVKAITRQPSADSLIEYLKTRNLLLVLDNCEHLIDATAALAHDLLLSCPRLRILATSRESLRVTGETVHEVVPLTIPGPAGRGAPHSSESEMLFLDRAQAVAPHAEITPRTQELVAEVCRRLEGIPLAIELAAVRLRSMSIAQLADNLANHWGALTRGSRTAPARQRTMKACIDWSFNLCSPAEQDLWAGVSVFAGGFELDAAQAVCAGLTAEEDVADVIAALVDKSILVAEERSGRMRFRLLPPIRHRGLRRLAEMGQIGELRRRHRDWFAELVARASEDWLSPRQVDWIERLGQDERNLQAAVAYCVTEPAEAVTGLLMGARLLEYGLARGLLQAGRVWFDRLLALSPDTGTARAQALRTACWWSAVQGDTETASGLLREGKRLAEPLGEPLRTRFVQATALVALFSGDAEGAVPLFEQAIAGFEDMGDGGQVAQSLYLLALGHALQGHFDEALRCHARCLAITLPVGECCMRAYSLWIAGFAHWRRGDDEAVVSAAFRESLELSRRISDPVVVGLGLEAMAWTSAADTPERAATLLGAASRQWERAGTSTAALAGLFSYHQDCLEALAGRLAPEALRAAWDAGAAFTDEEAACYALGGTATTAGRPADDKPEGTTAGAAALTQRQYQIAGLIARGLSNRDIADELVISKRTAETHVENILTKLGFTTRHQIIAWMNSLETPADGS